MDEKFVILITGIGGNVAQGVMRNLKMIPLSIKIVGTNIKEFSPGNHLADSVYVVPYAWEDNFIQEFNKIIVENKVDLIIPTTDFEGFYLSKFLNQINSKVLVSSHATVSTYIDKYKTFIHHKKNNISFADSILPGDEVPLNWQGVIAKPRLGRGSRGIKINPKNLDNFDRSEYLFQELLIGKEITTAVYVTKTGKIHGLITLERSLENGTTIDCVVIDQFDSELYSIALKIVENSQITGPFNIQSIVDDNNKITPFEINCRISGTNSLRSHFGFNDVNFIIDEYLLNKEPKKVKIIKGKATRILMDVIYFNEDLPNGFINSTTNHIIF